MNQDQLIRIFNDTVEMTKKINTNSTTKKYNFSAITNEPNSNKKGVISVIPHDTITSAMLYKDSKVCMLNMASPSRAGGGVRNGRRAQEECLFRSTTLSETITQDFYPLEINESLYTTDGLILKDKDYGTIDPHITVDTITIAAINLNKSDKNDDWVVSNNTDNWEVTSSYENTMKMKIRLMLSLAYKNNCDTIILGAWGCGVFNNDPKEVSQMFHDVLIKENKKEMFDNIVFGVINDHNSVDNNFQIFKDKFEN